MEERYLVFTGRPNSGKSSIIRMITGLETKSGKRPGTTRWVSVYPLSRGLSVVDMPGYGRMTGVSKSRVERVKDEIVDFIESKGKDIALAVPIVAANKIDKLGGETASLLVELKDRIAGEKPSEHECPVFPVSAKTGEGLGALKDAISQKLADEGFRTPFKR